MRYPGALALIMVAGIVVTGIVSAWPTRLSAYADKAPAPSRERPESTPGDASPAAPLVVIDPGHGGSNTGAAGVEPGVYEKHVTLALARELESRLRDAGYRVLATRDRDQFLTLRQRVDMANRAGADLFVSLHANATETRAQRGYETYILSPRALDVDTRALRGAFVPAPADNQAGSPAAADHDVALLLADVERGFAQEPAANLARRIQDELARVRDPADDRGVRQESMHVLLGATMPAVLVEVGFVDHALEGRELLQPEVQAGICQALERAIRATLPLPR